MRIFFTSGRIIDGRGGLIERGSVLVEGEQIVACGADVPKPRDADRLIDLAGRTLMPGMIDTHVHLAGGDYHPERVHEALPMASFRTVEAARRTLMAGFTMVRSAVARDFIDVHLRDAIDAGLIEGPRIIASGPGITMTGGHIHETAMEVDGPDEVRKAVRYQIKRRVDSIKLMLSGGVATADQDVQAEQFTLEEVQAAVYEAHKAGKMTQPHAIGLQGIMNGVRAGLDSIDHGIFLNEEAADLMKAKGIYYVPTFGPFYYYTERRLAEPWRCERADPIIPRHVESFKMALAKGLKIAMGCDCGAPSRFPNGENALEFWLMVRYGMDPMQAIVAGTSNAATLLRRDRWVGSIEPGKLADLIVIDGNPLDDIEALQHKVRFVMKGGRIYRDELT
jgi:imidazolonepropionase-like amidohydrolase